MKRITQKCEDGLAGLTWYAWQLTKRNGMFEHVKAEITFSWFKKKKLFYKLVSGWQSWLCSQTFAQLFGRWQGEKNWTKWDQWHFHIFIFLEIWWFKAWCWPEPYNHQGGVHQSHSSRSPITILILACLYRLPVMQATNLME